MRDEIFACIIRYSGPAHVFFMTVPLHDPVEPDCNRVLIYRAQRPAQPAAGFRACARYSRVGAACSVWMVRVGVRARREGNGGKWKS